MAREIKLTSLESNPGILPFKLGNAKLRASYHTFLHYFTLKPIETELLSITNQYESIKSSKLELEPYHTGLKSMSNLVSFQLNLAKEKLNSLHFHSNNRIKRGIINGLGTVFKSITGNLDAEDGKRYDEAINTLNSNQKNIATTLNRQISLTTKIIEDYNKTLSLIKQNEARIADKIKEIARLNALNVNDFLVAKNAYDEISTVANIILQILSDLENAVTFARLRIFHNSILKLKDLEFIIQKLLKHYSPNELFFGDETSNIHRYYELIDVESYYSNDKIVFMVHFPLVYPEIYSYYHLYPVPTINNTILIPTKSYLAMGRDDYQYEDSECKNIHPSIHPPYCENKRPLNRPKQQDCIYAILQLNNSNSTTCESVPVIVRTELIEQITAQHYITIFPNDTKLKLDCHKTDFTTLRGTYLIELPTNCSFQTTRNFYINNEDTISGQPLLLPAIRTSINSAKHIQHLVLHDIPLDKIQQFHREQQTIHQLALTNLPANSTHTWIAPTCCLVILVIALTMAYTYKIRKSKCNKIITPSPRGSALVINHTKEVVTPSPLPRGSTITDPLKRSTSIPNPYQTTQHNTEDEDE